MPTPIKQRPSRPEAKHLQAHDLRGYTRLVFAATAGLTDLVEALHGTILNPWAGRNGQQPIRTSGITGLVYRTIGGVTRSLGSGVDTLLAALPSIVERGPSSPEREALVSALNGVLGDYLDATDNPLAIPMTLVHDAKPMVLTAEALRVALPKAQGHVVVCIHGLCMNDLQWTRGGHNHGAFLAAHAPVTPVYLRYNTGLPIADNGHAFALLLEALMQAWPVPVSELTIIGHSMGGLVARSACLQAEQEGLHWRKQLKRMVFLGTPHVGAPLEKGGHWVDILVGATPWSAPFAKLGKLRSRGITDLRHGTLLDGSPTPLPRSVRCCFVAATTSRPTGSHGVVQRKLWGDGLVPLDSALGIHPDPGQSLKVPATRKLIVYQTNHLDLLSSQEVAATLAIWISRR